MLSLSIPFQGFQPADWGNLEFLECGHRVKLIEFTGGNLPQRLWAGSSGDFGPPAVEDILCAHVLD
jgi:hypothetical protein